MRAMCRHCNRFVASRPRGLCYYCSRSADVRALYPTGNKYGKRVGDHYGNPPLPEPTTALPSTPEKILVLAERVQRGLALHHPQDAAWQD